MQDSGQFCGTVYRSRAQWAFIAAKESVKCQSLTASELIEADQEWKELPNSEKKYFEDKSEKPVICICTPFLK